jgi:hypothetical protein
MCLIGTSLGAGLYLVGCWPQGKSSKPKRPDDPIAGSLFDMQRYIDLVIASLCLEYGILKDEATDYRRPYPSREEYDREKQLPPAFEDGDKIDPAEVSYICQRMELDESAIMTLAEHNRRLVMNYLRLQYWNNWLRSRKEPQPSGVMQL